MIKGKHLILQEKFPFCKLFIYVYMNMCIRVLINFEVRTKLAQKYKLIKNTGIYVHVYVI